MLLPVARRRALLLTGLCTRERGDPVRCFGWSLILLILLLPSACTRGADNRSDERAVRSALDTYAKACETCDFELLSSVFSHDRDIVLINLGATPGLVVGWPSVAELYRGLFSTSTGVRMQYSGVSIKVLGTGASACVTCSQQVDWVIDGKPYSHEGIRMTCVLEKQQGRWRIVHGHWSLPSTQEPKVSRPEGPSRTTGPDTPAAKNPT